LLHEAKKARLNEQDETGYRIDEGIEWKWSISKSGLCTALRFYGGIPSTFDSPSTDRALQFLARRSVTRTPFFIGSLYRFQVSFYNIVFPEKSQFIRIIYLRTKRCAFFSHAFFVLLLLCFIDGIIYRIESIESVSSNISRTKFPTPLNCMRDRIDHVMKTDDWNYASWRFKLCSLWLNIIKILLLTA